MSCDWRLCILCQEHTSEHLECPSRLKQSDSGKGYITLVNSLNEFMKADALPSNINQLVLDTGMLQHNNASWHKSCRAKFNSIKLNRVLKRKKQSYPSEQETEAGSAKVTRSASSTCKPTTSGCCRSENICFFCDTVISSTNKYKRISATIGINKKVRKCATDLGDTSILTKLATGDMVAIDATYHANCLTSFYKRHTHFLEKANANEGNSTDQGIVFAELLEYMEEARHADEIPIFKLVDLVKLYNNRLCELGVNDEYIHATRLKDKKFSRITDISAYSSKHSQGQGIILMYDTDVADLVQGSSNTRDYDSDAIQIAKAARIVRLEIFKNTSFNGSFSQNCQENAIPTSLKALVDMVLYGPSITNQSAKRISEQPSLTIAQSFMFNAVKKAKATSTHGLIRHRVHREPPLPLYVGLKLHAVTRKKGLTHTMFRLGMSVSYDRFLQVLTDMANGACERFEADGVVCPVNMKLGLFTVGALDNCDHNPTSATAQDSFHGTSISLFQFPSEDNPGTERSATSIEHESSAKLKPLPDDYAQVPPAILCTKTVFLLEIDGPVTPYERTLPVALAEEKQWLAHVKELLDKDNLDKEDYVTWSAYHASCQPQIPHTVCFNSLLPLFYESAHTVAMIKHGMTVIKQATHFVNPGHTVVMAVDQPLYALAKQVQLAWPYIHGEDKYLIMFGRLHIEMAVLRALGTWLEDM